MIMSLISMSRVSVALAVVVGSFALACSKPPAESPEPTPEPAPQPVPEARDEDPGKAVVQVSPTIASACGITEPEAYFAYNSSKVSGAADGVLQKLATCFTTGPLAGKTMSIVGHTDPRGDEEYNMTLGGRRSDNIKAALVGKGLPDGQAQTTSRGEMEARGTDEASWAKDRKVDINLAN
jgi:peptidoglycan-associated lipoprotein